MTVFDWPEDLAPKTSFFDLIDQSVVYTDSRSSASLRQKRSNPVWMAQFTFDELEPGKWERLAALLARLKGSVNCVRAWDFSSPGSSFGAGAETIFDDGTTFDDGTGFDDAAVILAADVAVGDETIQVQVGAGAVTFKEGMKIGLPNDFLYLVIEEAVTDVDGLATVSVAGPARQAVAAGEAVVTLRPTARMFRTGSDPIQRGLDHFGAFTLNLNEEVRG